MIMGKQPRMEFSVQAIADLVIRDALYLRRFEDPIFRLPRLPSPSIVYLPTYLPTWPALNSPCYI